MLKASLYFERQILERIQANDRKVLGELYKKYQRLIFGHVIKNGGSEKDAEDILQETVIALWQKVSAGNFELSVKLGTFLLAIAKNKWLAELRKMKKNRTQDLEDNFVNGNPGSLEKIIDDEKIQIVRDALNLLAPVCKKLLLLFYFEGRSMTEIAGILDFANADVAKAKKYQCKSSLEQILKNKISEFKGII
jgi:RNA polymerase sigma factor (sigma-70 family)